MQSTTTREEFRALAAEHRVVPVTRKVLADSETPLSAYRKLAANRPGTFLLESAENGRSWSRWSFIGAGAPSALTIRDGHAVWLGHTPTGAPTGGDPLQALQQTIELLSTGPLAGVPPLGDTVGEIGSAPSLATPFADKISAAAVFGNPAARFGTPLSTTGLLAGRAIDQCNMDDPICSPTGDLIAAHEVYEFAPYPQEAADFVAGLLH